MKKVKMLFWIVLLSINTIGATESLTVSTPTDSARVSKVVKLLHDFEKLSETLEKEKKYSDSLLIYANDLEYRLNFVKNQLVDQREVSDEYKRLYNEVENALKEMTKRKEKLERKVKRTRLIGIISGIALFIVGIIVV